MNLDQINKEIETKQSELETILAGENITNEDLALSENLTAEIKSLLEQKAELVEKEEKAAPVTPVVRPVVVIDEADKKMNRNLSTAVKEANLYGTDFGAKHFDDLSLKTLLSTANGIPANQRTDIVAPASLRQVRLFDFLNVNEVDLGTYKFMQESFTNASAEKAESVQGTVTSFAESAITFAEKSVDLKTVGHKIPVSLEQSQDWSGLGAWLENRLTYGVLAKAEAQLIAGTGASGAITGMLSTSSINTDTKGGSGVLYHKAIWSALDKVFINGHVEANLIIMHPADFAKVMLEQGTANDHFLTGPSNGIGREWNIFGVPVFRTTAIAEGKVLTLDSSPESLEIVTRPGITVEYTNSHGTDFVDGLYTYRAFARMALAVYKPKSICYLDLTS